MEAKARSSSMSNVLGLTTRLHVWVKTKSQHESTAGVGPSKRNGAPHCFHGLTRGRESKPNSPGLRSHEWLKSMFFEVQRRSTAIVLHDEGCHAIGTFAGDADGSHRDLSHVLCRNGGFDRISNDVVHGGHGKSPICFDGD